MSKDKDLPIGSGLAQRLREAMDKQQLTLQELADKLKMSKPYITALLAGDRPLNKLSGNYLSAIAEFLNLPKMQVYNLAEILAPEDFIGKEDISEVFKEVQSRMSRDPSWMHMAPSEAEWERMDTKTKVLVCYLYDTCKHANIIKRLDLVDFSN